MGHHHNSYFGYGLLVLHISNNEDYNDYVDGDLYQDAEHAGFGTEMIGDLEQGEDMGLFIYVKDAVVTVNLGSDRYFTDYVVEYTEYSLNTSTKDLSDIHEFRDKHGINSDKIGVFQVSYFG